MQLVVINKVNNAGIKLFVVIIAVINRVRVRLLLRQQVIINTGKSTVS